MPSQYAVLDIDGNGVDELIIYGNENEWGSLEIFTADLNSGQISLIQGVDYSSGENPVRVNSISAYCGFKYSEKYHAIVYQS